MYHITLIIIILVLLVQGKIKSRFFLHILCVLPIVTIILLRYGVGPDYFSYEYIYNSLDISSFGSMLASSGNLEFGFKYIFYFGRILNLSYTFMIAIIALVMTFGISLLIQATSDNIPLSYLLYYGCFFIPWNLNAVRQGVAIVFSLYLMFGNNNIDLKYKALLLVALMSIHVSVIIVLPLYLISTLNLNKKTMLMIIGVSMILSIIPVNMILGLFNNIPFLSKFSLYITSSSGLFDFQSLSRLLIMVPLLYFYDNFDDKTLVSFSLLSFSLYFMLKSNELIASRMSVYGFFLIIILYTKIAMFSFWNKKMMGLITVVSIVFSGMFYIKEFDSSFRQSNYVGNKNNRNWISIFNKKEYQTEFLNQFNLLTQVNQKCSNNSNVFFKETNFSEISYEVFEYGDTFETVQFPNKKYGVINQDGKIVIPGEYSKKPQIRDYILTTRTTGANFSRSVHIDLRSMNVVELDIIEEFILDYERKTLQHDAKWFNIRQMYYEEMLNTPLADLIPSNEFEHLSLISFSSPIWYNIVESSIYKNSFMYLVDNKLTPLNNSIYTYIDPFPLSKITRGYTSCGTEIINQYGDIIWFEKSK